MKLVTYISAENTKTVNIYSVCEAISNEEKINMDVKDPGQEVPALFTNNKGARSCHCEGEWI